MSYVIDKSKERIERLELHLENAVKEGRCENTLEDIKKQIANEKERLQKLLTLDVEAAAIDMKAILSHTHAIEDKYKCRSVRFMFWLADFVEQRISLKLGKMIANYTVTKIHAPVCSIVAGSKPDLPPMPKHGTKEEFARLERAQREREEWERWRDISVNYLEAPVPVTRLQKIKKFFTTKEKKHG